MGTLVLLRHGQSQWNLENRFTGWVDVDLSEKGVEEAKAAGKEIQGLGLKWDEAHTSRLKRAQRTLEIVLEILGQTPPITQDSALNERHYGDLQGLDKDETRKQYGEEQVHIWRRSYDIPPPGGECLADTSKRTLPYFKEYILKKVKEGQNIIVAAHGNSLRSIAMVLHGMSPDQILKLNLDTGKPYVYVFNKEGDLEKSPSFDV